MSGQVALVTGSTSEMGNAICCCLAAEGHKVVGLDLPDAAIADFPYYQCDLRNLDQLNQVLDRVDREQGLIRTLVNNAGIWHGRTFFDIRPADYEATFDVNVRAMFFATQTVARRLVAAGGGGAIISIASVVGHSGSGVTDYGGSKAAIMSITKGLARTLGQSGIRVNAVAPGPINTAMGRRVPKPVRDSFVAATALRRAGEPQEVADAVAFLVGPRSSYITGAIVDVHGGS